MSFQAEMSEGDPAKSRPPVSSLRGVREAEASAVTEGVGSAVPKAHENIITQTPMKLQVDILQQDNDLDAFVATISGARFSGYLKTCKGDRRKAVSVYHANARISQCLYLPIQIWEIALRNRLNAFLCWKYNQRWPWDSRVKRNLSSSERKRLEEALERQGKARGASATTDMIVADLSAGFWVGLLTKSYEASFAWKHNSHRIFPASSMQREEAYEICVGLLTLRNRICHHEAIYHLPLEKRHADLTKIIAALCQRQSAYHSFATTFATEWSDVEACLKDIDKAP